MFGRVLTIDLEGYDAQFDTTVILETEFHENNNIFTSHPDKHKRNWKSVSTINVTHAPIQINCARNIASNYLSQQQPDSSFTTVLNVRFFPVKYVINSGVQPLSNWHNQVTYGMENGTIVFLTVYSDADQRKHQSSVSLAFVRGIHRGPVNSPHKWPVTRKMFPFDDVIMYGE